MDSYNNDEPSLLQRSVKTNDTDKTDMEKQTTSTDTKEQTTSADVKEQTTSADLKEQTTSAECAIENPSTSNNDITIKLKFINDDQKLVTGSLKEMLGEFKR